MRDPLLALPECAVIPYFHAVEETAGMPVSYCEDTDGGGAFFWTAANGQRAVVYRKAAEKPSDVVMGTREECARYLWRRGHRAKMTFDALRGGN